MRSRAATLFVAVVVTAPLLFLGASTLLRAPTAAASSTSCTGSVVDIGQARGSVAIRPWWFFSSGVFFDGAPLGALVSGDASCPRVTVTDHVANAALSLALPSGSVVTLVGATAAEVEIGGVTYAFSTALFSTITSAGSSTLVVGTGTSVTASAGPSGIAVGGALFDKSFSTLRGNGSATRLTLSGTGNLSILAAPGSASFGTLSIFGVSGGFTGTTSIGALLPSGGASELSVLGGNASVTIGSTTIPLASFGSYAAQGLASTTFATDGSLGATLVGNGASSSLSFRGLGPGVVSYASASSGTATAMLGAASVTTTFSRMGHVTSSWQAPPAPQLVTGAPVTSAASAQPAAIEVVAAVARGSTHQVVVTWAESENATATVTSWTVVPLNLTTGASGPSVVVNGLSTSATVHGLVAGDVYAFEVIATSASGTGSPSAPSNSVVPLGVAATVQKTAFSASSTGTASSSIKNADPATPSFVVHAHGRGSVTLGVFSSDPISPAAAVHVEKSGTVVQSFFDVAVAPSSDFSSLSFVACHMRAGQQIMWWNPASQTLKPVSKQTSIGGPGMCITAEIAGKTKPTVTDLYGTVFAVATPKAYADATSPGSFWVLSFNGQVKQFGKAKTYGSVAWRQAGELEPFVAISPSIDAKGYLVVSRSGAVLAFGDAKSYGSISNLNLKDSNRVQIISITRTEDARGYWLTSATGGVFAFGDAKFYGSAGKTLQSRPSTVITAMARTPDGEGYWLVTNDGEVFAFGDAGQFGSALHASGIVGITTPLAGKGYLLASRSGAVYPFGDARKYGPPRPKTSSAIIGITSTADGKGYYLISANGTVVPFGDARATATSNSKTFVASGITTP